jgi:hypothetical protein
LTSTFSHVDGSFDAVPLREVNRSRTGLDMRRARFALVSMFTSAIVIVLGCTSSGGGPSSPPPSVAEQCRQRCAVPTTGGHPCVGQPAPEHCQEDCEATLAGKSEACTSCFINNSGWQGTECTCEGNSGIDIGCSFCTFRGNGKSCSVQITDQCTHGAKTCEGWKPVALDDDVCAESCGFPKNETLTACKTYCHAPTDKNDPCTKATPDQIKSCVDACVTKFTGKTIPCMTCYFSNSSFWEGQTCSCSSGTSCEQCNWIGNSAGSRSACGPTNACTGTQCRGFVDRGIDGPKCAALCDVPVGVDAGSDAGTDAPLDAPKDAPQDAPADG